MLQCGLLRWNFALAICFSPSPAYAGRFRLGLLLPAVVAERLVGFGHPVGVLTLLHGRAAVVHRVMQLVRAAVILLGLALLAGPADDPGGRHPLPPLRPHLDRHLIGRA